jgi:hypothetical protein
MDLKQRVVNDIVDKCLSGAQDIFDTLMPLFQPFLNIMSAAMKLLQEIKAAYQMLDRGYVFSSASVAGIFLFSLEPSVLMKHMCDSTTCVTRPHV